jgi:RNA polymerase sigma-70 factor (ECF subfamily)
VVFDINTDESPKDLPQTQKNKQMSNLSEDLCEERTYTKVFVDYSQTLHNYLFYKSGNAGLAQDLTQEAFTRLWQKCASVLLSGAKNYVFRIANNLLINEYQHQKVVLQFQQQPAKDKDFQDPEYLLEEQELQQQLEKAIAELPESQRVVFLLSRIDKKTYKEIAEIIGISKQAVEKRIYKALDSLRQISNQIK